MVHVSPKGCLCTVTPGLYWPVTRCDVKSEAVSTNKEKILKAASDLLLEKGIDGLSVRAIAAAAGLSTIAIYSHFDGKQGVLDALYMEGFALVQSAVESVADVVDPRAAVMQGARNYLALAIEREGHYRLVFGETGSSYAPTEVAQQAARDAFAALVSGVARLLPPSASLATQQRAALKLWALLHGYVSLRHHVIGGAMEDRQWQAMAIDAFAESVDQLLAAH